MARLFRLAFYSLVALLALLFALLNSQSTRFNYYFGQADVPLSLMLVMAIALGALLGVFAGLSLVIKAKRQARIERKNAEIAERELAKLRALPLKE